MIPKWLLQTKMADFPFNFVHWFVSLLFGPDMINFMFIGETVVVGGRRVVFGTSKMNRFHQDTRTCKKLLGCSVC